MIVREQDGFKVEIDDVFFKDSAVVLANRIVHKAKSTPGDYGFCSGHRDTPVRWRHLHRSIGQSNGPFAFESVMMSECSGHCRLSGEV
jgi:hypothetical protein